MSVNTGTKTLRQGAGKAADLHGGRSPRQILENSTSSKIVVEKSTLPVRTAEAMEYILNARRHPGRTLRHHLEPGVPGRRLRDPGSQRPDRVLIGGRETESGRRAVRTIVNIYAELGAAKRILTTNLWSSELSKLTANAFLAQRISSINAISALCERTRPTWRKWRTRSAWTADRSRFLQASVGFGGSCFRKDILNLVYLCEHYNLPKWRRTGSRSSK